SLWRGQPEWYQPSLCGGCSGQQRCRILHTRLLRCYSSAKGLAHLRDTCVCIANTDPNANARDPNAYAHPNADAWDPNAHAYAYAYGDTNTSGNTEAATHAAPTADTPVSG